jgi:hypothetical protein
MLLQWISALLAGHPIVFDLEYWMATTGRPKPAVTKMVVATPHFNFAFLICEQAIKYCSEWERLH